jgi:hypothetical protein
MNNEIMGKGGCEVFFEIVFDVRISQSLNGKEHSSSGSKMSCDNEGHRGDREWSSDSCLSYVLLARIAAISAITSTKLETPILIYRVVFKLQEQLKSLF